MIGNPRTGSIGLWRGSLGQRCIASRIPGQRMERITLMPQWPILWKRSSPLLSIEGNSSPYMMGHENDSLTASHAIWATLLTNRRKCFSDVRTFWSPASIERVTRS